MRTPILYTLTATFIFALLLAPAVVAEQPPVGAELPSTVSETRIIAVKMDADWCGKCRAMNPKLDAVMPEFMDDPILFVKFNMTDEFATRQAGLLADRLNLASLFKEHQGRTGYMVLLDAGSGKTIKTLTSDLDESQLKAEIRAVL
jgi:thiol-disulfide isomerase/thioredoxin